MGISLKKSLRKDSRVHVERAVCYVNAVNSPDVHTAEINDISVGGLSFFMQSALFNEKTVVEVKIPSLKGAMVTFLSMIRTVQTDNEAEEYRYAVRFDRKLSEKEFQTVLKNLALIIREMKGA